MNQDVLPVRDKPASRPHTLSVCIITLNEEDRLERCLKSVQGLADEIIVFDSGSTDATVEIARRYTDKVWVTDWPGYGAQKQRALEQARMEWVLVLDADEELDATLRQAIARLLEQPQISEVAFKLRWAVIRHGKRLRFGRSARAPLRLLLREGAWFSPDQVHERIHHRPGKVGVLPGYLLHYTARDYGHALKKNAKYAWLGSQKYFAQGRRNHSLTLVVLRAIWTFFLIYIIRGGFLDGRIGFIVAMDYMQTNFNKHAGLWILTMEEKRRRRINKASYPEQDQ
ncbi:MAG TPA: glycosyltransferase family 2 protein [Halothiobacillus sp.]|nr:glycosyltransferase family 2 protein [Halothiobacillus sp.]